MIISDTGISAGVGEKLSPNGNTLVSADVSFFDDKLTTHLSLLSLPPVVRQPSEFDVAYICGVHLTAQSQ